MGAEFIFSVISSLSGLLSSLRSSGSTSSEVEEGHGIEGDLDRLERLLNRIQATLHDAGEREIREASIKLWLKEIKSVAFEAEDILDGWRYELLRSQIEESSEDGRKRKRLEVSVVPDRMAGRIKSVIDRFEEISRDREALYLRDDDGERWGCASTGTLPTTHMVNESAVFGRDEDKKQILGFVFSGIKGATNDISVIPIVGMGGVGKTTLAQLVFNDPLVRCSFDMSAWVYVSPQFDVTRITKGVLESISENVYRGFTGLSVLQRAIEKNIKAKKVFLVLDDVWNELPSKWEQFMEPFQVAESVRILVTTRNKTVGQIVQTTYTYHLRCLPQDQSNLLFEHYAFGGQNIYGSSRLREIGARIIKKCDGLPLAIKSIGRALSCNMHGDSWRDVLESDLWKSDVKDEIFPALKVSYYRLPPELKPCLLFCSLFPKGYRFNKDEIIYLWIAHGYIQSRGRKSEEVIGDEFIYELNRRSFLMLDKQKWEETFTLHDLIHDLARSISMGEFYTNTRGSIDAVISGEVHHVYTENCSMIDRSNDNCLLIRTLVHSDFCHKSEFGNNLHMDMMRHYNLRVLKCKCAFGLDLEHLGNLTHLRYLELSHNKIERLPKSSTLLFNLVALRINFLEHLKELPVHIGKLINLSFLSLTAVGIQELPESLGELSNLQTLYLRSCPKLRKLPLCIANLRNLKHLYISNLNIKKLQDSCCMLNKLQTLVLERCWDIMLLPDGIGNLINLRSMYVLGGNLRKLPKSIDQLCNLEVLELTTNASLMVLLYRLKGLLNKSSLNISIEKWEKLDELAMYGKRLPSLMQTESLNSLFSDKLPINIKKSNKYRKFKSLLECLQPLNHLVELNINGHLGIGYPKWFGADYDSRDAIFMQCYLNNNKFFAEFGELPSLKSLQLIGGALANNFSQTIATHDFKIFFPSLEDIEFTDMLEWNIPDGAQDWNLPALCSLRINNCPNLTSVPKFVSLRRLEIIKCSFLSLELNMLHWQLLESLHIEECIQLTSLQGLQTINTLRSLYVVRCPLLEEFSFPRVLNLPLCIEIVGCPSLKGWCQSHQFNYTENFSCKTFATSGIRNIMNEGDQEFILQHLLIENSIEHNLKFHKGLCNLVMLEIKSCWRLETLAGLGELMSLRRLVLWDCPLLQLKEHADDGSKYSRLSSFLMSLVVCGCHGMVSLNVLWLLKHPSFLTELEITNCKHLMLIVGLQYLTNLDTLAVIQCPRLPLEKLPTVPDCVVISGCPRLKIWCEMHSVEYFEDQDETECAS